MKRTERILEDWACANLRGIMGEPDVTLVGRQVCLPNGGRIDLIVAHHTPHRALEISIIELKRDRIDPAAVTQLLGYVGQVHAIKDVIAARRPSHGRAIYVRGVAVAPTITAEAAYCIDASRGAISYVQLDIGTEPGGLHWRPATDGAGEAAIERTAVEIAERLPAPPPPPDSAEAEWWEEINTVEDPWLIELIAGTVRVEPTWADYLAEELF